MKPNLTHTTSKINIVDFERLVPSLVLQHLTENEKDYLHQVFVRFNGYPSLNEIWQLMDEQWIAHGCNPEQLDERVTAFYRHPVWLLNGLFIEQHVQSLENRRVFTNWVSKQRPARVADFGGGFGGLARFIGQSLPDSEVEVVDPHPHPAAIALASRTPNVRFVSELNGKYDMLIATDVFEHVQDPLGLVYKTAVHLHVGGKYLMANCFQPVILCHLPRLFYFQYGWDMAMSAMGLVPRQKVQYGRFYTRDADLDINAAKKIEKCAAKLYPFVEKIPKGNSCIGKMLVRIFC